jgi:hypothetical protein
VRGEDEPRAALEQQADGGKRGGDAVVVRDASFFERHVEVDTAENASVGDVQVAHGKLLSQAFLHEGGVPSVF